MDQINPDILNQGIATMRSIANAFKAAKDIEAALALYAQTQGSLGDLTARRDGLSNEVINLTELRDTTRAELDQEVVRLAEYRETEKAKIAEEGAKAKAESGLEVAFIQQQIAQGKKELEAQVMEKNAFMISAAQEIANKQKILDGLKAELAAIAAKIGG